MHVKFVILRDTSTLGGHIYALDAISPTEIGCTGLDFGGHDESFIRLSESGHSSPTFSVSKQSS